MQLRRSARRATYLLRVLDACDLQKRLRGVRQLAGAAVDEPELTRQADLLHFDGGELPARQLGQRAALWQERHAHLHLDRALDGFQARQRHLDVDGRVLQLEGPQDALTRGRRDRCAR